MTASGPKRIRTPKRALPINEVNGLCITDLQRSIHWNGQARLLQTGEDAECLLAECEWPKKSGNVFYACASTGLLFDKQSGACKQSSTVVLMLETLKPKRCTEKQFAAWLRARMEGNWGGLKAKPGPKAGSQRKDPLAYEPENENAFDD